MAGPGKRLISTTTCWPVVESRRETPFSHIQCNPDSPSGGVAHGSIVGGGAPHSGRCVVVGPSPIAGDELDGGRGRAHSEWTQTEPTPTTKLRPMPAATLVAPTPISPTSSPASPIPTATIPLPDADNWHLAVVADPPLPDARLVLHQPRILQIGQAAVSAPAVPQRVHAWIMWEDGVEDLVPIAQVCARHASEVSERASATVSEYDSHARY